METYTGAYGIVGLPDEPNGTWIAKLGTLAFGATNPRRAQFSPEIPHLTLYHGKLVNVPRSVVAMILDALSALHITVDFMKIEEFGGKFLFLDVKPSKQLQLAHLAALNLSRYLDRSATPSAMEERLKLNDDEALRLERYGHPLTFDAARPHFTIAYDPNGFAGHPQLGPVPDGVARIDRFAFAQIGQYGAVKRLIEI